MANTMSDMSQAYEPIALSFWRERGVPPPVDSLEDARHQIDSWKLEMEARQGLLEAEWRALKARIEQHEEADDGPPDDDTAMAQLESAG
jgi:hypothetical protein